MSAVPPPEPAPDGPTREAPRLSDSNIHHTPRRDARRAPLSLVRSANVPCASFTDGSPRSAKMFRG
eukprot:7388190-Prymnesium_polylepis.1